ncbi:MAG: tyrosine-type recombinase/integrase [Mesorhizobium sp.]
MEDLRIHDLRHNFASFGAGGGMGLPIIGKLLGHAQPATTARYAHLDTDPLRRASNAIGNSIAAAMGEPVTPADHTVQRKADRKQITGIGRPTDSPGVHLPVSL